MTSMAVASRFSMCHCGSGGWGEGGFKAFGLVIWSGGYREDEFIVFLFFLSEEGGREGGVAKTIN